MLEEFENTKGAIRIRISKKNRQHVPRRQTIITVPVLWSMWLGVYNILSDY